MARRILLLASILGGALAGQLWKDVCTQSDTKGLPFCDRALPRAARVADYVQRVPLSAKANMMQNGATPFDELHIPAYQWGSEGLHGPLQPCVCEPTNTTCRCPTSFPCPAALGSTFNDTLWHLIGRADGREARAINNLRNHATQNVYGDGIDYWSPTINLQRDPRWGRNQEVSGEDPLLTSRYARAFVTGLQQGDEGEDAEHVQIVACCKHFVANSMENWNGHTRNNFNANVSKQDLANYYLPPFQSCVTEGRSLGIMCSYNAVNGVPSCANTWLLNDTLRNTWEFPGYVTSDCGAINNICQAEPDGHGYTKTCAEATRDGLVAGTDVDCGGVYTQNIVQAVNTSLLTSADVDRSFSRLTDIQMRLGLFDSDKASQKFFNYGIEEIDSAQHQQLALEAAHQAIVLLKNDDGALPLEAGKSIAVIGPHFNGTEVFISNYHGSRCLNGKTKADGPGDGSDFSCIQTPLSAITAANVGGRTEGALGCEVNSDVDEIADAVAVASEADVVVLVMGIDGGQEAEGKDRYNTTLPGRQIELATKIMGVGKPVVLVLANGGALSLGSLKESATAIVAASYAGEMASRAIADVLFGAVNPSGKLVQTWYPVGYVASSK